MKTLRKIPELLFVLIMIVILSCGNQKKSPLKAGETAIASKIEVSISGMTCTGCEQTIQTSVTKLEGVSTVKADYKSGKAIVDFNPDLTDTSKIRIAITHSGYKVTGFNQADPEKNQ